MWIKEPNKAEIKKEKCRFMMLCRVKESSTFRFKRFEDPLFGWIRGDKYEKNDVGKMLQYLVSFIKNHHRQYVHMTICDTTKNSSSDDYIVLKILNGIPKINRLPEYSELLKEYNLPEQLSYEIKPEF